MIKRKVLLLLRTNLSAASIFKMMLDINIQAIEEVQKENQKGCYSGEYFPMILAMSQGISEIKNVAETWKKTFREYKESLDNCDTSIYSILINLYNLNSRWFNTLRSTLYIMEEDLLVASQPSVVYLWNQFFQVEDHFKVNFTKSLKIRDTYGKFTEGYFDQD